MGDLHSSIWPLLGKVPDSRFWSVSCVPCHTVTCDAPAPKAISRNARASTWVKPPAGSPIRCMITLGLGVHSDFGSARARNAFTSCSPSVKSDTIDLGWAKGLMISTEGAALCILAPVPTPKTAGFGVRAMAISGISEIATFDFGFLTVIRSGAICMYKVCLKKSNICDFAGWVLLTFVSDHQGPHAFRQTINGWSIHVLPIHRREDKAAGCNHASAIEERHCPIEA